MAYALSKVEFYGIQVDEAITSRFHQVALLSITGLAADIDLDIGDYSGTFWTAVGGSAIGAKALLAIKDIQVKADTYISTTSEVLAGKIQVASAPAAGQYTLALNGTNTHLPEIGFAAGGGATSFKVLLQWRLKPDHLPEQLTVTA